MLQKKFLYLILFSIHFKNIAFFPPLSTSGNQIVNPKGKPVRLKGVSWFGFETSTFVPHGLWARNYKAMMDQIKSLGFNTIRLPYCNQMFDSGSTPNSIDYNLNPGLKNLKSIQILDKIIQYADQIGLYIILDHHRSNAGSGPNENGLWYTSQYPRARFVSDWKMLAARYKNNKSFIGADLSNEPHGPATWTNVSSAVNWKLAAQQVGNEILKINPKLLIIVEGIEVYNNQYYWWGGNLMGVNNAPILLIKPNKLVYSPHDYPDSVYPQPWFYVPTFPNNLPAKFTQMWGYIFRQNKAPVIVGELGSKFKNPKDIQWFNKLAPFMNGNFNADGKCDIPSTKKGISWIWWSWNPNSSDTGGILLDDWRTPDANKLNYIKRIMKPSCNA